MNFDLHKRIEFKTALLSIIIIASFFSFFIYKMAASFLSETNVAYSIVEKSN